MWYSRLRIMAKSCSSRLNHSHVYVLVRKDAVIGGFGFDVVVEPSTERDRIHDRQLDPECSHPARHIPSSTDLEPVSRLKDVYVPSTRRASRLSNDLHRV